MTLRLCSSQSWFVLSLPRLWSLKVPLGPHLYLFNGSVCVSDQHHYLELIRPFFPRPVFHSHLSNTNVKSCQANKCTGLVHEHSCRNLRYQFNTDIICGCFFVLLHFVVIENIWASDIIKKILKESLTFSKVAFIWSK